MFKKMLLFVMFCAFVGVCFVIGNEIINRYVTIDKAEKEVVVVKEVDEKIIIPYTYNYTQNNTVTEYERENGKTVAVELDSLELEKKYNSKLKKEDKLYDMFTINKMNKTYDINLDRLGQYDFLSMLDVFPIAPYFDRDMNTLYVYSHSSGKISNPGADYYELSKRDIVSFIDYDMNIVDEYKVVSTETYPADEYNNEYFTTYKDSIVFVTCRPLNSDKNRLVVVLEKMD